MVLVREMTNNVQLMAILSFLFIHAVASEGMASSDCIDNHNQLSSNTKFELNCKKESQIDDDVDNMDPEKHSCFMMRWYCASMCNNGGKCSVSYIFSLNLKIDKANSKPLSLDCVCGFNQVQKGCAITHSATWESVEERFANECAAVTAKSKSLSTSTTAKTRTSTSTTVSASSTTTTPMLTTSSSSTTTTTARPTTSPITTTTAMSTTSSSATTTTTTTTTTAKPTTSSSSSTTATSMPTTTTAMPPTSSSSSTTTTTIALPTSSTTTVVEGCPLLNLKPNLAALTYAERYGDKIKYGGTAVISCQGLIIGQFLCNNDATWSETCSSTTCWSYLSDVTDGYYKAYSIATTFDATKTMCDSSCAQLVTLNSANEVNHAWTVFHAASQLRRFWIGMSRGPGGGMGAEAQLQWLDGSPVSYLGDWHVYEGQREPNCDTCPDDCDCIDYIEVYCNSDDVCTWNDVPSDARQRGSLCALYVDKSAALSTSTTALATTTTSTAPLEGCNLLSLKPSLATVIYTERFGDQVKYGGIAHIVCNEVSVGQFSCNDDGTWTESCAGPVCWSYLSDVTKGYYKAFDIERTFDQAKATCATNCAQLPTLHSNNEEKHVVQAFRTATTLARMWIGMVRGPGGGKGTDANLTWIDGSPVSYQGDWFVYYGQRQPGCGPCTNDCNCIGCVEIFYMVNNGILEYFWNDLTCDATLRGPVCALYVDTD